MKCCSLLIVVRFVVFEDSVAKPLQQLVRHWGHAVHEGVKAGAFTVVGASRVAAPMAAGMLPSSKVVRQGHAVFFAEGDLREGLAAHG